MLQAPVSLPALAQLAERQIRRHGPRTAEELTQSLSVKAGVDVERAAAAVELAVLVGRLTIDRGATLLPASLVVT